MLLEFSDLYVSGAHKEQHAYDKILIHTLGYLSAADVVSRSNTVWHQKKRSLGSSLRRQWDTLRAIRIAAMLLIILGLGTVLPPILKWFDTPTIPRAFERSRPDLISCDVNWYDSSKHVSDYQASIRNCMRNKTATSRTTSRNNADPTKCCGLW